jgi:hypothetical protein
MSKEDFIRRMRVASPCPVGWDSMSGDERVRFCRLCQLNVYNISELTGEEVRALVEKSEGRICGRIYRRADGTVLTRDCRVGLRALRRRAARVAGAALAALLSLASVGFGQKKDSLKDDACPPVKLKLKREAAKGQKATVSGVVVDPIGAVIPGATVSLIDEKTKKQTQVVTNDEGKFDVRDLAAGSYTLQIEATGFKQLVVKRFDLKDEESVRVDVDLNVAGDMVTVGVIAIGDDWPPEPGRLTIKGDTIRKLPIP